MFQKIIGTIVVTRVPSELQDKLIGLQLKQFIYSDLEICIKIVPFSQILSNFAQTLRLPLA